mmetsp:Transcript_25290/g.60897  ORF Transcript_25290/g.60897 Transcript_25290/m.60897 type:complete len:242 (-) Transcript_25290:810-1535(-)
MSTSLHSLQVTGAMRRMVVTLSRKADSTAVTVQRRSISRTLLPPASLHARTPVHSKTPVRIVIPTISIIPHSRPRVPWSIHEMTCPRVGTRFWHARTIMTRVAPIMAAMVRCSTSVMIMMNTTHMMPAPSPTCEGPRRPRECSLRPMPTGPVGIMTRYSRSGLGPTSKTLRSCWGLVRTVRLATKRGSYSGSRCAIIISHVTLRCFQLSSPSFIVNTAALIDGPCFSSQTTGAGVAVSSRA